ncbi:MAG: chemotaxis response regulator protein-glutamate methylesterase [Deltaproteobacteria bacterium]|nr:chemotaxis response regulator protein-glutamate methylesterase [Deltaproteobacteria bacterium]
MGKKIKVLVIDDSAYNRKTISEMLSHCDDITVIGTATDGKDALKRVVELKPDIITLDLEMPRMDGFTFLRIMMKNFPTPTLVISSRDEDENVFKALELGAVDFLAKPTHHISSALFSIESELIKKISMVKKVNMGVLRTEEEGDEDSLSTKTTKPSPMTARASKAPTQDQPSKEEVISSSTAFPMVLIGSSTGGPPALQTIFKILPGNIGAGIAISQHMPKGFTKSFADRLNKISPLRVAEATNGAIIHPGSVIIAPGGYHLSFKKSGNQVKAVLTENKDHKYVPSVDLMFTSGAEIFGDRTISVIMTGMGDDGAKGIKNLKSHGGVTIAQSEQSSVIFGMPREAINTGAIDSILSLERIANEVDNQCRKKRLLMVKQ